MRLTLAFILAFMLAAVVGSAPLYLTPVTARAQGTAAAVQQTALTVAKGSAIDVPVVVGPFPSGLAGFNAVLPTTTAFDIVSVSVPDYGLVNASPSSVVVADLNTLVQPGAPRQTLFTVRVQGVRAGSGDVRVRFTRFDDEGGSPLDVDELRIRVRVTSTPAELCLTRQIGSGTVTDPYRTPKPDITLGGLGLERGANRWALYVYDELGECVGGSVLAALPADLDADISALERNAIRIGLGLARTPFGKTYRDVIVGLLRDHGDPTGETSWKPLGRDSRGRARVVLGGYGEIHNEPPGLAWRLRDAGERLVYAAANAWAQAVEAASAGDNFNRANESLDAGNWTEINGNASVVSNKATSISGSTEAVATWADSLDSTVHEAQTDSRSDGEATVQNIGPGVRADNSTLTMYFCIIRPNADQIDLWEVNGGTYAELTTVAFTVAVNTDYEIRLTADGTALECFVDGGSEISTTDATLTSGTYAGMYFWEGSGGNNMEQDNFRARATDRRVILN